MLMQQCMHNTACPKAAVRQDAERLAHARTRVQDWRMRTRVCMPGTGIFTRPMLGGGGPSTVAGSHRPLATNHACTSAAAACSAWRRVSPSPTKASLPHATSRSRPSGSTAHASTRLMVARYLAVGLTGWQRVGHVCARNAPPTCNAVRVRVLGSERHAAREAGPVELVQDPTPRVCSLALTWARRLFRQPGAQQG